MTIIGLEVLHLDNVLHYINNDNDNNNNNNDKETL